MKKVLIPAVLALLCISATAQYTTDKVLGQKKESLIDSLKTADYPYLLPIWGQKVVNKGFNLPRSAGMSVQYIWQESDLIINNLQIGFNNGPKHSLDEIVRFDKAQATSRGVNVRPDIWLFPFLNVYGILAKSNSTTAINCGLWLPDDSAWTKVVDFDTKADFQARTLGFGITPTMGVAGYFFALDMNFTWSDIDELDEPAYIFVLGPRIGKNFTFKDPRRSLAFWVGGFRVKMASQTNGSLAVSDLFPIDQWEQKIQTGFTKLDEKQQKVDSWWGSLTPAEQRNPINIAKHETANAALGRAGNFLNAASMAVSSAGDASVQYSLTKKPKDMWNFIMGSQFQLNKSLMVRAEYGFLSSRQQLIVGLQYRFNL